MTAAIQSVSNATASTIPIVLRSSPVPVGTAGVVPSTVVTLGAASSTAVANNPQALFDALLQEAFASQSTSGFATTGSATTTSVADFAALLGFDTSATSSSILNAALTPTNTAASVAQAVTSSLTSGITSTGTTATGSSSINQSLIQLLADSLNSGTSTLDNATAASLLGASGILQGQATSDTQKALNGLLTIQPGLAATLLNLNNTSSSLLDLAGAQATTTTASADQSQLTPLTPVMNLATASLGAVSAVSPAIIASNVSATSSPAPVAVAVTSATSTTPVSTNSTATITSVARDLTSAATSTAATTAAAATGSSDTSVASNAVSNNFLQDYAAQALANIAGNPAYASIAGAMYMSAMIVQSQLASADSLPDTTRIAQPVYAVQPVNAV